MDGCLLCGLEEKSNYHPSKNVEYICSGCVGLLLDTDADALKTAYIKAKEKGYTRKVRAIESFLQIEKQQKHPKRKKDKDGNTRKRIDRTRSPRPVRHKKKPARQTTPKKRVPLS